MDRILVMKLLSRTVEIVKSKSKSSPNPSLSQVQIERPTPPINPILTSTSPSHNFT